MINYVKGNLFTSNSKILVNTVNTVGVMGKGIAADFKKLYPEMYKIYKNKCVDGSLDIGKLFLYKTSNKWILNFPTKKHWRSPSKLEYIEKGLQTLVKEANNLQLYDIAMPKLGCGNGGLDWEAQVKPLVEKYLKKSPINVTVYEFDKNITPEHLNQKDITEWLLSDPDSLNFLLFFEDLKKIAADNLFDKEIVLANEVFTISYNNVFEYFEFKSTHRSFKLSKNDLKVLFYTLKNVGRLCGNDIFMELHNYSNEILDFIAELPYVLKNDDKVVLNYTNKLENIEVMDFDD